jgi:hypothetical protein
MKMKDTLKHTISGFVGALFAISLMLGLRALADGDPGTDGVKKHIPYQGTLEKDGVGVNATVEMTFELYDGGAEDATLAWSEVLQVPVYAGRFSVLLGSSSSGSVADLTQVVRDADDLHLAILVTDGDVAVPLSNRQRFVPLPYALWSTSATDFQVAGTVLGGLRINGSNLDPIGGQEGEFSHVLKLSNGDQSIFMDGNEIVSNGTLYLQKDSPNSVVIGESSFSGANVRGLTVYGGDVELVEGSTTDYVGALKIAGAGGNIWMDGNEINSSNKLYINNETDEDVEIGDDLHVTGHITGGHINCHSTSCGAHTIDVSGGNSFGSWKGWTHCPNNTFMCGLEQRVENSCGADCDDTGVNDIKILCCPF